MQMKTSYIYYPFSVILFIKMVTPWGGNAKQTSSVSVHPQNLDKRFRPDLYKNRKKRFDPFLKLNRNQLLTIG